MNLLFMIPQDHDTWNTEYRLNSYVYVMQVTPFLFFHPTLCGCHAVR